MLKLFKIIQNILFSVTIINVRMKFTNVNTLLPLLYSGTIDKKAKLSVIISNEHAWLHAQYASK